MELGILVANSRQFNKDNFEFVNFPDFCGDATTVVLYLNVSILNSPLTVNIYLESYSQGSILCQILFIEISYNLSSYPQGGGLFRSVLKHNFQSHSAYFQNVPSDEIRYPACLR